MMVSFAVNMVRRWVLISITLVLGLICNSFSSEEGTWSRHRQNMFSKFIFELHGYETEWHRCTYLANYNKCLAFKNGTQTHFHYPFIVKALDSQCTNSTYTGLYECMKSDAFVVQLLDVINQDMAKTVNDVCCLLRDCSDGSIGHIASGGQANRQLRNTYEDHETEMTSPPEEKQEMRQEICFNCSMLKTSRTDEKIDDKLIRQEILYNMTCTKESVANFLCTQLNVIAINVLSSSSSSAKLLEDAKNILKQCNRGFYDDPSRTFSALHASFSDDELYDVESFFTENVTESKNRSGLGKVFGMIAFVAILTICVAVICWLYWIKPFRRQVQMNTVSRVAYSVLNSGDVESEDNGGTDDNRDTTLT